MEFTDWEDDSGNARMMILEGRQEKPALDFRLTDMVISWTIEDIFNEDRYRDKVEMITETFESVHNYLDSFVYPLIEETRADLCCSLEDICDSPYAEIIATAESEGRWGLFYYIEIDGWKRGSSMGGDSYQPKPGDVLILSTMKPESVSDLNRHGVNYFLASVVQVGMVEETQKRYKIKVSKSIEVTSGMGNSLYAMYLTSITTNIRIWKALHLDSSMNSNLNVIEAVLDMKKMEEAASGSSSAKVSDAWASDFSIDFLHSSLDISQKNAVLGAISAIKCQHSYPVQLVKGPPGTGKTKTVSSLLWMLLNMNCRTLACAATNIAVFELCSHLVWMVKESRHFDDENGLPCPLGSLVLFGKKDRMFVPDELQEIFLDFRVKRLSECFAPISGWKHLLVSLISLLRDCIEQYNMFLENEKNKENDVQKIETDETDGQKKETVKGSDGQKKGTGKVNVGLKEFLREKFKAIASPLVDCMWDLWIHLPRSFFSKQNEANILALRNMLEAFGSLLHSKDVSDKELEKIFFNENLENECFSSTDLVPADAIFEGNTIEALVQVRRECLRLLITLQRTLKIQHYVATSLIKEYCLKSSNLLFCTASSSSFLHYVQMKPMEVLVIDEAAQLKECESLIPLRLKGLRHTILIGDERQLPSMVKSEVSRAVGYGRSLFERLIFLGHDKHLLNVQYRMHPAISSFPNAKFYDNQISDGSNVKRSSYEKHYLPGPIYGAYSFINISDGREEKEDAGKSWRNMVEVAVVLKIIRSLFKSWEGAGKKLSIGVVSPYSAQVKAIDEKMANMYEMCNGFSVKIRSVDGFQGGEEDVIILSTVRSNCHGTIGFLDSLNRTNVALTRARHCLWILGNAFTLSRSDTIWAELVNDAKKRRCLFNADIDKGLAKVILDVKHELNQLDDLLRPDSILLTTARWKVLFSDDFRKSFAKLKSLETRKAVIQLLLRLADGWRPRSKSIDSLHESQLAKQCKIRDLFLIWMVDIEKDEGYSQLLRVWDIIPQSEIPKLVKRLDNVFAMYTDDHMNHCKMRQIEGKLEIPMTWKVGKEIIRYKKHCDTASETEFDVSGHMENSKVSESFLLMKFYSLSSGVVKHLLTANDGMEIDLPFVLTDQEQDIIRFPSSTFILGRSGTGKTTVLTMKMVQKEQQHCLSSKGLPINKDGMPVEPGKHDLNEEVEPVKGTVLRQLFVTVSPKLSYAIRSHISRLQSFISGGDYSDTGDSIDMHDISDSLTDFLDIPDSFVDIPQKHFPLVVTFQKFLLMLDGTMNKSFFYKFHGVKDFFGDDRAVSKSLAFQAFIQSKEINYERFVTAYWPHFNAQLTKKLDPSTVFTQIISHIKGGQGAGGTPDGKLSREEYVMLSESRISNLSSEKRERIYNIFLDYEKKKLANEEFDLCDFVSDLHYRLTREGYAGEMMDFVYIDEVQDLTMRQIALFKYVCKNYQEGFVFAGDTAQTIARGIDFRFQDIRSLFYKEFLSGLRSECNMSKDKAVHVSSIFHLNQNFRTHAGVLKLSQSVMDLLYRFFKLSVDVLSPEISLIYGESPVILDSGNDENAIITIFGNSGAPRDNMHGFGAEQVILVRDDCDKQQIFEHVGKQALVLTVVECKGLEFQDVLLYNFFGSSLLKSQWRVIYEYMKEQNLLDSTSPRSFPSFDRSKHDALFSELKHLYVAITRTRQRLWICETTDEYSKPMFDFWKKSCLVQVRHLDSSLAQAMQSESSPEDWRSRGIKLFNEGNFEMATMCFERAGDEFREKWAKAAGHRARADRILSADPKEAQAALRNAAEIYESIGKAEAAAGCLVTLKEYKRAGEIYLWKCGTSRLKEAGECFSKAGCWVQAAEVYAKGRFFSKCLFVCKDGRLFDKGLQYIEEWKQNSSTNEFEKLQELDGIKREFLESCAVHYFELGETKHMMTFVKALGSMDLIRSFLRSRNLLDELLVLEIEAGNYMEAADIARMKGNLLLEAEILEKAGDYEKASHLIMFYVVMNSLWTTGSKGWPLKKFSGKEEHLVKAKSLAELASTSFYEFVCLKVDILSEQSTSLPSMSKQLDSAQRFQNTLLEILSQRKIVDAHLQVGPSNFHLESEMVLDVKRHADEMMSQNYFSIETLVYFWKSWMEKIMNILSRLCLVESSASNDCFPDENFCLEYFGVLKKDKNTYVVLNSNAYWIRGNYGNSPQQDGNFVWMDAHQFTSKIERFWATEVLSVGMKVLKKLESFHCFPTRIPLSFFQRRVILHLFEVSKLLNESKCCDGRLYKFINLSKQWFYEIMFPFDCGREIARSMFALRECEIFRKMLDEILVDNLKPKNGKLTHGQIGRVMMLLFVSGSLSNELFDKIRSCLVQMPQWKAFVEELKSYLDSGSKVVSLVGRFKEALESTFNGWSREHDYISPHCFMYLIECLLFLVSSLHGQRGFFFTTKFSLFEIFVCQHWKHSFSTSMVVPDVEFGTTMGFSLEFIAKTMENLLFDKLGTREWIRMFYPNNQYLYHSSLILRVIVVFCLSQLNSPWGLPSITNVLSRKDVLSDLPRSFSEILRRVGLDRVRHMFQVSKIVAQALSSVGNPLVVVCTQDNCSKFLHLNTMVVSLEKFQCKEDVIALLFPKSLAVVDGKGHTRELQNTDRRKAVLACSDDNHKDDSEHLSTSKTSEMECQDSGIENENECGDLERKYGLFWGTFDIFEPNKHGHSKNMDKSTFDVHQIKLDMKSSICVLDAATTRLKEKILQQGDGGDVLGELKYMLDELKQLSDRVIKQDYNISTIQELFAKIREQMPRLKPFLDSLFIPSAPTEAKEDPPATTVASSSQGKGNKGKRNNKSKKKGKGKSK